MDRLDRWDREIQERRLSKREQINACQPLHPSHGTIHWTACSYDQCPDHLSIKEASYFPKTKRYIYIAVLELSAAILENPEGTAQCLVQATIFGISIEVIIDTGAIGVFINPGFIARYRIPNGQKHRLYRLTLLGGKDSGRDG